jgi:hypothetical protein
MAGSVEGSRLGDSERLLAVVRSIAPPSLFMRRYDFGVTRHHVLLLARNCCVCLFLPDFLLRFLAKFPSRSIGGKVIAAERPGARLWTNWLPRMTPPLRLDGSTPY